MASETPEVAVNDRHRLVGASEDEQNEEIARRTEPGAREAPRSCAWRHKWCLGISLALFLILICHAVAVYFIYLECNDFVGQCVRVKVLALNTWGMPALFGSQYKTERMLAIRDMLAKGEHDLYLFEELWMEGDHNTVASGTPGGFTFTGFRQLALPTCDGRVAPTFCSGLAIASRYPIEEVEFNSYTWHGDAAKAFIDGEYLAKKGVGRVRIKLFDDVSVDVFVTHTAADPDQRYHDYNNSYYRDRQVKELMEKYVNKSRADVVLLGGDFNAGPDFDKGLPYKEITDYMKNCVEEIFYKLKQWLAPRYSTYANPANTFSFGITPPVIYDYIFYRSNRNDVQVWTNWFDVPFLKFPLDKQNKTISYSDHEAVMSTIHVRLWP